MAPQHFPQYLPLILLIAFPTNPLATSVHQPVAIETALAPGETTPLDRLAAPREAAHARKSGFRLVSDGPEAFAIRARSARWAMRSLDIQTFIWREDLTGQYLVHQVLYAADRGVRVRLLVDDMDARRHGRRLAALAGHHNIAVRYFNPFSSKRGLHRLFSDLLIVNRLNHRMHNKTWIADNRMAVVGGRNIGDEYFDASTTMNFVDLDFAAIGPIVRDASMSFDRYWNSSFSHPAERLAPDEVTAQSLVALRIELEAAAVAIWTSEYAQALLTADTARRLIADDSRMQWSNEYRFAADDPLKATLQGQNLQGADVRRTVLEAVSASRKDLVFISPYFVPGGNITKLLTDKVGGGRRVRVVTNSLVANDVSAVHGGYSRYRKTLLSGGVELWELKSAVGQEAHGVLRRSSEASLHTKALILDHALVFVGSYNLDPRSAWINCEQGILVRNDALAKEVLGLFERYSSGARSWSVALTSSGLSWTDGEERFSKDPYSSPWQRFLAWLVRGLRLDAQL